MKHPIKKKFSLARETVRQLSETALADALGGRPVRGTGPVDSCETCTCPPAQA